MNKAADRTSSDFLEGGGETGELIRSVNWAATPLGPIVGWPASRKAAIALILRSPLPIVTLWGEQGVMIYNDAYSVFAGARHPELLGSNVREGWPEIAGFNDNVMKVILAGGTLSYKDQPLTLFRPGRPEQAWINLDYSPAVDESGTPDGVICILTETTERVDTDRRLAAERERQRLLMQQMPGFAAFLAGPEHRYEYVNDAYVALVGQRDFAGRPARDVFNEFEGQGLFELLDQAYAAGETVVMRSTPVSLDREDGERFIDLLYAPIRDDTGAVIGIFAGGYDVTEQVRAFEALSQSEERYRTLFEAIEAGFCIIEMLPDASGKLNDYRYIEVNPAFEAQSGLRDAIGRTISEMVPGHEQYWYDLYRGVIETGEPVRVESGSASLDRWWDVHAFRVSHPGQNRIAVLFNDISDRRRAELALRDLNDTLERRIAEGIAERKLLADIVESTDAQILVFDEDYRCLAINRACTEAYADIFGRHPGVGDDLLELLADQPDQRAAAKALCDRALAGEAFTTTYEFGDSQRGYRSYEMSFEALRGPDAALIGAFLTGRDVTERVREQALLAETEEALRQSQKMEAIGQLTGGVAHDFNNLLTPIVGTLDLLQRNTVGGEREQRLIAGAAQSADRARTLVQRLLAFARRQPLQTAAVDIARLITGMADLVSSTTGPQIKVVVDAPENLPPAKADHNQLEMALLNLAVNARDAMPDGGTLRITASSEKVARGGHATLRPGRYVKLSVADTGSGMSAATLARATEPFFSTKGIGKGTGLGLSMVHGLALQLGGALDIRSAAGLGTNVELWLPESMEPANAPAAASDVRLPASRGTALLVDDEEFVRISTADMLSEIGYDVIEAASAEAALAALRNGASIDLVVTDHLMPGMTGSELARTLGGLFPKMPVLVISGYAEGEGIAPDLPRLTKPFRKDELVASLGKLLS